jgi:SAM-dependent methyltransferase
MDAHDATFAGSIPMLYDSLLVPMIFADAAEQMATAVGALDPDDVLEIAAGTGVVTRAVLGACPRSHLVATDLNTAMLEHAQSRTPPTSRLEWQVADGTDLPFADACFDVALCQFGVMFFPDRVQGYREARRVLRPGGTYFFSVWDRIENNQITWLIMTALNDAAAEPMLFMQRTPHGYFDRDRIRLDLEQAGMSVVTIDSVEGTSRTTAHDAAVAFCQGTPLSGEIDRHPTWTLERAVQVAEAALRRELGDGPISGPIRSFRITARPA